MDDSGLRIDSGLDGIRKIAVIGFGTMGQGIAQVFAQSGYDVKVFEIRKDKIQFGLKAVKMRLRTLVQLQVLSEDEADATIIRIKEASDIGEAAKDAEFVQEAVPENIVLKKKIFKQLDQLCGCNAILASCTSSFCISEITSNTKKRDRCVGTHWFNPPYIVPLVEVIKGSKTSDSTIDMTKRLLAKLGKLPIVCRDSPGFIANRIQHVMNNEAMLVFQEGLASAEDIDTAIKMSFGLRLPITGSLQSLDLSGLDVALGIRRYLRKKLRSTRFRPPKVLIEKVKQGHLGLKTGKGFHDYRGADVESVIRNRDEELVQLLRLLRTKRDDLRTTSFPRTL